jgi:hypothetical protein
MNKPIHLTLVLIAFGFSAPASALRMSVTTLPPGYYDYGSGRCFRYATYESGIMSRELCDYNLANNLPLVDQPYCTDTFGQRHYGSVCDYPTWYAAPAVEFKVMVESEFQRAYALPLGTTRTAALQKNTWISRFQTCQSSFNACVDSCRKAETDSRGITSKYYVDCDNYSELTGPNSSHIYNGWTGCGLKLYYCKESIFNDAQKAFNLR